MEGTFSYSSLVLVSWKTRVFSFCRRSLHKLLTQELKASAALSVLQVPEAPLFKHYLPVTSDQESGCEEVQVTYKG